MEPSSELSLRRGARDLARIFAAQEARIRAAFAVVVDAEDTLNAAFTMSAGPCAKMQVDVSGGLFRSDFRNADDCILRLQREAWACVVDRLEIRQAMSMRAAEELADRLAKGPLPILCEETIYSFALQYMDVEAMYEEKIAEVFNWLRPGRHDPTHGLKTNERNARYELGTKVIRSRVVTWGWRGDGAYGWRVDYQDKPRLTALEAVFRAIDGHGFGTQHAESDLQMAIEAAPREGAGETHYFRFKVFKNGNMHLEFKVRPFGDSGRTLLDELNRRAGGKNLRPAP